MSVLTACGGATATTVGAGSSNSGCSPAEADPNGLNENQQAPGDQPGGVEVGLGDIAVAPSGEFVIFQRGDELAVGWTATGVVETLPVQLPSRLAFAKGRPVVYVGSDADASIHAVDVEQKKTLWTAPLDDYGGVQKIASTADDGRLVAAGWSTVVVIDTEHGEPIEQLVSPTFVRDLDILPGGERALLVNEHTWQDGAPTTEVQVLSLEDGALRSFQVPNCADNVIVEKTGARAFLAPTVCEQPQGGAVDPISVLDLAPGAEAFDRNLPGFGPVALGPDGTTAVGFLDKENVDEALFDDPAQIPESETGDRYFLMVIDTAALTYTFHPVGDERPRYAMTPDGQVLLLDSENRVPARLMDLETGEAREIQGASLELDNFVLTSDSTHAYVLQSGLWELDIEAATAASIPTDFIPWNINITPDDQTLFLRQNEQKVCVFPLSQRRCATFLSTEVPSL